MNPFECSQQDGNFRQAGGIHHFVAVDLCQAWVLGIGHIDQRNRQLPPPDRGVELQVFDARFELCLEASQ